MEGSGKPMRMSLPGLFNLLNNPTTFKSSESLSKSGISLNSKSIVQENDSTLTKPKAGSSQTFIPTQEILMHESKVNTEDQTNDDYDESEFSLNAKPVYFDTEPSKPIIDPSCKDLTFCEETLVKNYPETNVQAALEANKHLGLVPSSDLVSYLLIYYFL